MTAQAVAPAFQVGDHVAMPGGTRGTVVSFVADKVLVLRGVSRLLTLHPADLILAVPFQPASVRTLSEDELRRMQARVLTPDAIGSRAQPVAMPWDRGRVLELVAGADMCDHKVTKTPRGVHNDSSR